jgi:hypothetical protein
MDMFDLDSFIISHVLECFKQMLRHMQLHVTSQRPLGWGYESKSITKAMPRAHFFTDKLGPGVLFSTVRPGFAARGLALGLRIQKK